MKLTPAVALILFLGTSLFAQQQSINFNSVTNIPKPALSVTLSESAYYHAMFFRINTLQKMADDAQARGKDRSNLHFAITRRIGLTDDKSQILEQIAALCDKDVKEIDAQAHTIIDAFHKKLIGATPADPPEKPDAQLKYLWDQRQATILNYRDRLRAQLGEKDFAKLDALAHHKQITIPTVATTQAPARSVSPDLPRTLGLGSPK